MAFEDNNAMHALLAVAEQLGNIPSPEGTVESREGVITEGRAFRSNPMADAISKMSENISLQLGKFGFVVSALADRVSAIENGQSSARTTDNANIQVSENQRESWADRDPDEQASYDPLLAVWPEDSDSELLGEAEQETEMDGSGLKTVSEKTKAFLKEAFCRSVPNTTRRKWRQAHGMPNCEATKCPKLDTTVKAQISKAVKDGDRPLARLQTLVLDSVGPLTTILEEAAKGTLSSKVAADAATAALKLLGNASANISQERRHRVTADLNRDLKDLIEETEHFKNAAPLLFGRSFDQMAKNHVEAVRSLRRTVQSSFPPRQNRFFRGGRPQNNRGGGPNGGNYRGSGRGRYHPYFRAGTSKDNSRPRNGNGGSYPKSQ